MAQVATVIDVTTIDGIIFNELEDTRPNYRTWHFRYDNVNWQLMHCPAYERESRQYRSMLSTTDYYGPQTRPDWWAPNIRTYYDAISLPMALQLLQDTRRTYSGGFAHGRKDKLQELRAVLEIGR